MPKISAVGLFCCDKFEETPNEKVSNMSKLTKSYFRNISKGLVVGQEKDVSLFLDRTGEPATQQQVSSRLKNKDTSFSQPTTHP